MAASSTTTKPKLNIFFVHAQWLRDRERVITEFQKLLGKHQFADFKSTKVRVMTDHDPNAITTEFVNSHVNYTPAKEEDGANLMAYNSLMKNLHMFQVSNTLKHMKVLQEIAESSNDNDVNVVLEDDILHEEKICASLEKVIGDLPQDYEIVFLGLPSNLDAKAKLTTKFQDTKEVFKVVPYNDSYIISKAVAKKMVDNFLPIKFVTNIQFSYVMEKAGVNSKIAIPNIFMDGSKFGLFISSLTPNNVLMFNNEYMQVRNLVTQKESFTKAEKDTLEKIFKECPFVPHPDFQHMKALYLMIEKRYDEAQKIFESAFNIFKNNNCILNNESSFMKDYIKLHQFTQSLE